MEIKVSEDREKYESVKFLQKSIINYLGDRYYFECNWLMRKSKNNFKAFFGCAETIGKIQDGNNIDIYKTNVATRLSNLKIDGVIITLSAPRYNQLHCD